MPININNNIIIIFILFPPLLRFNYNYSRNCKLVYSMVQGIVFNGIMWVSEKLYFRREIMFLGIDGKYSAFEELMHYYHFNFSTYYFLLFIVLVGCIKAIVNFLSIKKRKSIKYHCRRY